MKTIGFVLSAVLIIGATAILGGCTQAAVRAGYGSMAMTLPCGQKLVNVSWKGETADLWVLTRPMQANEAPQTYSYKAKSTFSVFEGAVTITEAKCD